MTLIYARALGMWLLMFPMLFVINAIKAVVDFVAWIFDLPTNVWTMCLEISSFIDKKTNGESKDGDHI